MRCSIGGSLIRTTFSIFVTQTAGHCSLFGAVPVTARCRVTLWPAGIVSVHVLEAGEHWTGLGLCLQVAFRWAANAIRAQTAVLAIRTKLALNLRNSEKGSGGKRGHR